MPRTYSWSIVRDPTTRRFPPFILPVGLPVRGLRTGRLRGMPRGPPHGEWLELAVAAHPEGFALDVMVTPTLSWNEALALPNEASWEFIRSQGSFRYVRAPGYLRQITCVLNRTIRRRGLPGLKRSIDDLPYQPPGPWEYVPGADPRDLSIHSRLLLRRDDVRIGSVPAFFAALLTHADSLGDGPYELLLPGKNPYSQDRAS